MAGGGTDTNMSEDKRMHKETVKIGNGPEQLLFLYCPHCGKAMDGIEVERALKGVLEPPAVRTNKLGLTIGPVNLASE
mgnify:CR=1 FL=1